MPNKPNTFTCALCDHTFKTEGTNEEAMDEWLNSPIYDGTTDLMTVCSKCYQYGLAWAKANGYTPNA